MGVNDPTDPDYDVWVNPTGDAAISSIDIKNALGYIPLDRAYVDEKVVGTEVNPKEPEEDNLLLKQTKKVGKTEQPRILPL